MSGRPPPTFRDDESPDLFDYVLIRHCLGYVLRSVGRHRWLALTTFVAVVALTGLGLWGMPRTYHTETKILAQRNQIIAALGNPDRRMPWDADAPTRAAADTVMSRDNVVALIRQTNLITEWDRRRAPLMRLKDGVMGLVRGELSDDDKLDALIGLLEKRLWVRTDEGSVTIGIDWPDAEMAFQLVDAAKQNLLEARHAREISTIAEAISILEAHAEDVRESVREMTDELSKLDTGAKVASASVTGASAPAPRTASAMARRSAARQDGADPELAQLEVMLAAKKNAIEDLERFRQRRLSELQAQLVEQRATYADQHPLVVNTLNSIESLSRPSLQIVTLTQEAQDLQQELEHKKGLLAKERDKVAPPVVRPAPEPTVVPVAGPVDETKRLRSPLPSGVTQADVELLRMRLDFARAKYDDLLARMDGARIELDSARAAFKYRYSVVKPPQVEKKPVKPNVPMLLVAGLLAAVVLAVFAAVARDVLAGRVLETWQIERGLDLPVLAEIRK